MGFGFRSTVPGQVYPPDGPVPVEFAGVEEAARRASERGGFGRSVPASLHPSVVSAVHDVVIAEILAGRLSRR